MGAVALPVMAVGTALSAYGQYRAGQAAKNIGQQEQTASEFEASQMRQQAGQDIAASQRVAGEADRHATVMASRALAIAGASGAGVSDPTVTKILSDISGEGAYRSSLALYEGEEKARRLNTAAEAKTYQGKLQAQSGAFKQQASNISSLGELMRGGGSMYAKYGMGGPAGTPDTSTTDDTYGLRSAAKNYG